MADSHRSTETKPLLSSSVYNYLKYTVQIALPAAGTLYSTLAFIWGLPYGEQVVGTITALALFGGVLLGISKRQYDSSDEPYDGRAIYTDDRDVPLLEFDQPFENVADNKSINLKIDNQMSSH